MKRWLILVSLFSLLLTARPVSAAAEPAVSARAAVVYDGAYGRVLYEKNANARMLIASTTKIMTAVVALERCDMAEPVKITAEMANVEGSSMYLQAGKTYTVKELLYGLMLASGNDAATAIALHTAGSVRAFADMMNAKAAELGLENTHFENPHGLDGAAHYSSALDMARLMDYAMSRSDFAEIAGTRNATVQGLTYVNHNKLLWQCDGVIGGKTGYTMAAGRTLVTCCEREGRRLVCVTLSAADDWNDHRSLYDWAYGSYDHRILVDSGTRYLLPLFYGDGRKIAAEPLTDVTVYAAAEEAADYTVELPRFVFGPVYAGDKAGRIVVRLNGKTVDEVPLVYMENSEG